MATLQNLASVDATLGTDPVSFSTNQVMVTIVTGLTATMSADKTMWVNGPLTYSIIIDNATGTTYDLSAITLTDTLDITQVEFNATYGVEVDGTPLSSSDYSYNSSTGELSITLPADIADGASSTITYQVTQL